jgi:hypothetical protein
MSLKHINFALFYFIQFTAFCSFIFAIIFVYEQHKYYYRGY